MSDLEYIFTETDEWVQNKVRNLLRIALLNGKLHAPDLPLWIDELNRRENKKNREADELNRASSEQTNKIVLNCTERMAARTDEIAEMTKVMTDLNKEVTEMTRQMRTMTVVVVILTVVCAVCGVESLADSRKIATVGFQHHQGLIPSASVNNMSRGATIRAEQVNGSTPPHLVKAPAPLTTGHSTQMEAGNEPSSIKPR